MEPGNSGSTALCRELRRKKKLKEQKIDKARDKVHDKA